ncbi:MAG: hypothetical protein ACM3RX_07610 [Methanococcaceae archaeon]
MLHLLLSLDFRIESEIEIINEKRRRILFNEFDINGFLKEFRDIFETSEDDFFKRLGTLSLDVEEMIEKSRENINLIGETRIKGV